MKVVCGISQQQFLGGGAAERKFLFAFAQRGIKLARSKASVWVVVLDFSRVSVNARASNLLNPHKLFKCIAKKS